MDMACKWATVGILLVVFIGLMSFLGCGFHIAELIGSIVIAVVAARLFYVGIRKNCPGNLIHRA